jgi:hypothetical protein
MRYPILLASGKWNHSCGTVLQICARALISIGSTAEIYMNMSPHAVAHHRALIS